MQRAVNLHGPTESWRRLQGRYKCGLASSAGGRPFLSSTPSTSPTQRPLNLTGGTRGFPFCISGWSATEWSATRAESIGCPCPRAFFPLTPGQVGRIPALFWLAALQDHEGRSQESKLAPREHLDLNTLPASLLVPITSALNSPVLKSLSIALPFK
jgi:hypothetical protein